ncbi:MAG: calcium/sodium antiporter [Actinobacteria bacterium]|nr:calcium/sodium antiporter [Actinomycetota bacterium]
MVLIPLLGVVAGLVLLTYSADQFVVGAGRLAVRLRLSTVLIGAVVIGLGTSAPELVVSGLAAGRGLLDLAVGNIVGSNTANLTLVLGVAAMVVPITVHSGTLKREAPISVLSVIGFAVLLQGGLSRLEGAFMLGALVVAFGAIIVGTRTGDEELSAEVEEFLEDHTAGARLWPDVVRTLLGLVGTLVSAQILVESARSIATDFGLAEGFVGVTIVAVGTSLPELATSLQAARKNETDLIVGNLLGSNIFNSLAVGGTVALAGPGTVADPSLGSVGAAMMVVVAVVAGWFMMTEREVVRWEGVVLLAAWVALLPFLA